MPKKTREMPANQPAGEEAALECGRVVTRLFVSGWRAGKCEQLPFLGKVGTPSVGKDTGRASSEAQASVSP